MRHPNSAPRSGERPGRFRRPPAFGLAALLVLTLGEAAAAAAGSLTETSQLAVFVEMPSGPGLPCVYGLREAWLARDADTLRLQPCAGELDARRLAGRRALFLECEVPPGRYRSLGLRFQLRAPEETAAAGTVNIPLDREFAAGEVQPVFLVWRPCRAGLPWQARGPELERVAPGIPALSSLLFVTHEISGSLGVIDRDAGRLVDVVRTGESPREAVFVPLGQQIVVAEAGSHSLSVIDAQRRRRQRSLSFPYGDDPERLCLTPDMSAVVVLHREGGSLALVDLRSLQEISRVPVGSQPGGLACDDLHGLVYVTSELPAQVASYDPWTGEQMGAIPTGSAPGELVLDRESRRLYVAVPSPPSVAVLDLTDGRLLGTLNLCGEPGGMALDAAAERLYVSIPSCEEIAVWHSTQQIDLGAVRLDAKPGRLTLDARRGELLACLPDADEIAIVSTSSRQVTARIGTGRRPFQVVVPR